jgi:hypothetical protein
VIGIAVDVVGAMLLFVIVVVVNVVEEVGTILCEVVIWILCVVFEVDLGMTLPHPAKRTEHPINITKVNFAVLFIIISFLSKIVCCKLNIMTH